MSITWKPRLVKIPVPIMAAITSDELVKRPTLLLSDCDINVLNTQIGVMCIDHPLKIILAFDYIFTVGLYGLCDTARNNPKVGKIN